MFLSKKYSIPIPVNTRYEYVVKDFAVEIFNRTHDTTDFLGIPGGGGG